MAQTNYTPISLYYSTTASAVPTAANLVPGELAINTNDGKLYYEDSSGVVQVLATKSTGSIGGSNTQVQFNNSGSLGGSSSFTWDGTTVTATKFAGALNGTVGATTASTGAFTTLSTSSTTTLSGGTANGVTYLNGSKVLTSGSALTFDGTNFGVGTAASYKLHVSGTGTVSSRTYATDATGDASFFVGNNDGRIAGPLIYGSTKTAYGALGSNETAFYSNSSTTIMSDGASTVIKFAAGGNTEGMRLTSTGLGIGTSSPSSPLTIAKAGATAIEISSGATYPVNSYGATTGATQFAIANTGGTSYFGNESSVAGTSFTGSTAYATILGTSAARSLQFITNNVVRTTIDSSGNLLVGTTSTSFSSATRTVLAIGSGANGSLIDFQVSGATSDGYIYYDGTNATIENSNAGYIRFNTSAAEKMRLDTSGNLLVGTTSAISSGKQTISYSGVTNNGLIISESADTSGTTFLGFNIGATNIGNVSRVGATSAVIYNTTSDQRLKSNIADASPVLDKLMDVKVRQFDWTVGDLHQEAGFIAQELEPVLSGIVTKGKTEEDMWQMDYSRLTPYLVKAIQEQQALIESLTTRLTALENK